MRAVVRLKLLLYSGQLFQEQLDTLQVEMNGNHRTVFAGHET